MADIRSRIREYKRVLQIARKPTKDEFVTSGKICTVGILLIGAIGFAIFMAFVLAGI